jgi:hypothetical protein
MNGKMLNGESRIQNLPGLVTSAFAIQPILKWKPASGAGRPKRNIHLGSTMSKSAPQRLKNSYFSQSAFTGTGRENSTQRA